MIGLLQEVTEKCLSKPCLLQNGFKRAGIFPWNKAAPDRSKLLPGTVFASSNDSQGAITLPVTSSDDSSLDITFDIQPLADSSHIEQPVLNTDVDPSESPLNLNIQTDSQPQVLESLASTELAGQHDSYLMSSMDLSLTNNPVIDDTSSESMFQPISSSTFNVGSELQSTFQCSSCNRVILEKFRAIHLVNCSPPDVQFESAAGPSLDPPIPVSRSENTPPPRKVTTVQFSSLDEKKTRLTKFEVLLLTPTQVAEFNSLFEDKSWVQEEPLFSSWLILKLATIPSEKEALEQVLRSHKATDVPKK